MMRISFPYNASPGSPGRIILYLLMIVLHLGCAGAEPQYRPVSRPVEPVVVPHAVAKPRQVAKVRPSFETRLRAEIRKWRGTPHVMGGTSHNGVDCSGFVQRLYRDLFRRSIPRSTAQQVQSGQPVRVAQLSPGDLVFFKPPRKVRHVGIYLGNGEFAHASARKGVCISNLSETYWKDCFWMARRYLSD